MIHRTRFVYACCQNGSRALAEELVDERGHAVGHRVGVEQRIIERVPLPGAAQPDFQVVVLAVRTREDAPDLVAEVSLDLQHERARAALCVVRLPGEQLARERVHAGGRLAGADGPDDEHAGIESLLGDDEPDGRSLSVATVGWCSSPTTSEGASSFADVGQAGSLPRFRRPARGWSQTLETESMIEPASSTATPGVR